jgi:hypothetical protein
MAAEKLTAHLFSVANYCRTAHTTMPQRCSATGIALSLAGRYRLMFDTADSTIACPSELGEIQPTTSVQITCK